MISHYLLQKDYQLLIKCAALQQFRRGEIIARPGGWRHKPIYIIKSGLVAMYGSSDRAAHFVHMVYGPGEVFPISGFNMRSKDSSMQIGAKAETDVAVYAIEPAVFHAFMDASPSRKQALLNQVVEQFKLYTYRVENLEYPLARERVAYRLLLFASRFGYFDDDGILTIPKVSGKTVASAINLSEEAFSRETARLKSLGVIRYGCGTVQLLDTELLRQQIGQHVQLPFRYPHACSKPGTLKITSLFVS